MSTQAREWWIETHKLLKGDPDKKSREWPKVYESNIPGTIHVIEHRAFLSVCKERDEAWKVLAENKVRIKDIECVKIERDEWRAKYEELISYMPKVPTEPYAKQLAKEHAELLQQRKELMEEVEVLKSKIDELEQNQL